MGLEDLVFENSRGVPREDKSGWKFAPLKGRSKCTSRAGRKRPNHSLDKDSKCIFCDKTVEDEVVRDGTSNRRNNSYRK
jgi:hypothetical protein